MQDAAGYASLRAMVPFTPLVLLPLLVAALVPASDAGSGPGPRGRFERRDVVVRGVTHRYAVWLPPEAGQPQAKRPAILFLHGSGESGTDGEKPTRVGLGPALEAHPERWPFVVVFPQKPTDTEEWWEREDLAFAALADAAGACGIDTTRVALVGMSQGGHGVWMIGARHPERWRCLVPVCGYGRARTVAPRIRDLPVWCFQGLKDDVVMPHETREIMRWLRDLQGDAGPDTNRIRVTYYPDANHNSWDPAFAEPELPVWIARWVGANQRAGGVP